MKIKYLLLVLCLQIGDTTKAQDLSVRKKHYNLSETALAIEGYDPVAYFLQKKPLKGKKELLVNHEGVIYYFSSATNRDVFLKSPSSYEPEFGGWCAYAMGAKAEKVSIDPETFKIIDNKLYLFYNRFFTNTLKEWNKAEELLKPKAEKAWKKIIH